MLRLIKRKKRELPEFFIPKGPYKPVSMAIGEAELKRKAKLVKRISLGLEWIYYVAVTAMCVSVMIHLSALWMILYQ